MHICVFGVFFLGLSRRAKLVQACEARLTWLASPRYQRWADDSRIVKAFIACKGGEKGKGKEAEKQPGSSVPNKGQALYTIDVWGRRHPSSRDVDSKNEKK